MEYVISIFLNHKENR